jgi:hypothetical protein
MTQMSALYGGFNWSTQHFIFITKRWSVENGIPNTNKLYGGTKNRDVDPLAARRITQRHWQGI